MDRAQRVRELVVAAYGDVFGERPGALEETELEEDEDGRVQELLERLTTELDIEELDDDVAANLEELVTVLVARLPGDD